MGMLKKRLVYRGDVYNALEAARVNSLCGILTDRYKDGFHDGIKTAEEILANDVEDAPSAQEWISVDEKLPESGTRALVMRFDRVTSTSFTDILWFDRGEWWNRYYTGDYGVTHWMPLPKPPKEINNETN